jgi:parallel beta-helix repeat protein
MDNSQKALTVGGVFTFALVVALLVQEPTIVQSFEVPDGAYIKNESGILITYYPIKTVSSTEKSTSYYWTKLPNQTVLNCFSLNPEKFIFEANLNLADVKAYPVIARERINKTLTLSNEICEMQSEEYQECEWNEEIQEQFCSNKTRYFDVCHDEEYEESYEYGYRIDAGIPQEVNTSTQMEWIISIDTDRASKNTIWNYSLDLNSCGIPQTIIVDPEVTACAELNESNGIYNLTQNVSIDGSTCFTITAPNVTLDCNGYSITGDNSSTTYGVYSNQLNTTVKNCQISNFTYASYLTSGASNSLITSCALNSTANAALQINAVNVTVKDSNISTLADIARTISQVGDNATYINVTSNGSRRGLETSIGVISLTLVGCNLSGSYSGLNLGASDANTLAYNSTITKTGTSISTGVGSVLFVGANNNLTLSNTSIYSRYGICINAVAQNASIDCQSSPITGSNTSTSYGVYSTQLNTTVKNCNISNFSTGIYYNGADNGTIDNVTANTTYAYSVPNGIGIYIYNGANYNTIANSNAYSKDGRGILIYTSSNNSIINSTATAGTHGGIYIYSGSNNSIINSTATATAGTHGGIYIYSGSNNSIINSQIRGKDNSYGSLFIYLNSTNNSISNCTIDGMGATRAVTLQNNASNNLLFNNTIFNATNSIYLDANSGSNTFYYNNITGTTWVNDTNGSNFYNSTGIGNIYYFANGTPSWEVYDIYTNDSDNWADYGANRPFNSSLAEWSGSGADWHPYTLNTNYSIRITQNVSFTNATVGHWFYANATAYNPAGYNQTSNISASSGTCSLVSSTQTNWTLAVVYNCTAQTPSTATINITFFDVYQVRNSTQANNSYADPNIPVLTAPNISGTASVGYTLTCNAGNFSDADGDIENVSATTWRWFNGTTPIANATSQTWLVPLWYNGAVIKCEQNVTAQNWTTSQASNNSSAVTISNANPVNATLENMINATTSHQFNITAYADDADGAQDITVWNMTSTHGTCSFLSNTTGGNRRTVLINCYAQSEGTTELNITFADFNGLYNWTAKNFTYIDHEANLSAPFITPISNNSAENLTCNLGNWSDIDGDLENTSARSFRWFVNGLDINVSAQVLANGNFTTGDYISCEQFSQAQNWTTSNITVNSTEIYISNQSVNLVIVSPYNGSLISSCNFTALIFTGFQNGTTSRTATCNLSYNGQFITTQTKNVSNGFSTYVFYNLTNNGNYSITCQAQDSFSVSQTVSVHTQYYDMTACYADFYKKTSNTTTTFLYSKFEIEYFNVSEVLGVMLLGLAMFGMVSYATRLRKGNIFAAQS